MSARSASNAVSLDRMVRRLRRAGCLDDMGEVLAVAAGTTARLVDAACAEDSDVAVYARARVLQAYTAVLSELSGRITPVRDGDDPWERIARELEGTTPGEDAEVEGWDPAEK